MNNKGVWLFCGLLCVWPVVGWAVINFVLGFIRSHDWANMRWSDVRFPWSKSNE